MGDIHVTQLPCHVGGGAAECIDGCTVGTACQQHTCRRQQGVHRTSMQCRHTALVGLFQACACVEQYGYQCADMRGIAFAAGAHVRA